MASHADNVAAKQADVAKLAVAFSKKPMDWVATRELVVCAKEYERLVAETCPSCSGRGGRKGEDFFEYPGGGGEFDPCSAGCAMGWLPGKASRGR